jgi:predicted O-methyltransferase YrrM
LLRQRPATCGRTTSTCDGQCLFPPAAGSARLRRQGHLGGRGAWPSQEDTIGGADVTEILDDLVVEDEPLALARKNAEQAGDAVPVTALTGTVLRFLAAAIGARAVVEIGTGCGTSGIWLLRGMRAGSVLTSVDSEPAHHQFAKAAFTAAGFGSGRYRLITGRALEVLPRLADGAYDLVFCDGDRREYPEYLAAALRLLKPGGIVALDRALWADEPLNLAHRDPETTAIADVREQVFAEPSLAPLLLPIGGGLLAAVKRHT